MAKGLKLRIEAEGHHINLPRIPFGLALGFVRFGLWSSKYIKELDEEQQKFVLENKTVIINTIKSIIDELKTGDPFVLVEVVSDDANVLIEII